MCLRDNLKVISFLDQTCSKIKNKKIHFEIREELLNHIEDRFLSYLEEGLDEELALTKALEAMGDSNIIGSELNEVHKSKIDLFSVFLVSFLSLASLVIFYTIFTNSNYGSSKFISVILITALGFGVLYVTYKYFNIKYLYKYSNFLYLFALLVLVGNHYLKIGAYFNGASTPMIVVFCTIIILLSLNGILKDNNISFFRILLPLIFLISSDSLLSVILYLSGAFVIVIYNKKSIMDIVFLTLSIVTFLGISLSNSNYFFHRLSGLFNFANPDSPSNYIFTVVRDILSNSNLFGEATGITLLDYPLISSELIFTYIIGRFGFIPFAIVVSALTILLIKIFKYIRCIKNDYGKSLTLTAFTILTCSFILTLLSNLGLFPMLNTVSPFLSSSNVSIIYNMFLMGLILNIYSNKSITNLSFKNIESKTITFKI